MKKYMVLLLALSTAFAAKLFAAEADIPEPLKKACWIWPNPFFNYDISNGFALFRSKVDLPEAPKRAKAYITADQSYALYVNGALVAKGPARGFQRSWPFDEIDIAKYMKKGANIFAIRAYNPGKSTFCYISEGLAGVLFAFDIDGRLVASNMQTKCIRQNSCDRDTVSASMMQNGQEHIDMRAEPVGWKDADFDDSQWGTSEGSRMYKAMPYFTLEPRGIPMLEFKMLPAPKLIAKGAGKSGSDAERIRNVFFTLDSEKAQTAAVAQPQALERVAVGANAGGEFSTYVFDFGKIVLGSPILEVEGARGGEIVDILFDEQIDENFMPLHSCKTLCRPAFGVRAICRAGNFTHEFYNHWAFRYAVVKVRNPNL